MKLPNPNDGKPYGRIITDLNGEPVYGIRGEHTPDEEIVHIPSGQSNQQYWQPEVVMNPEGCEHVFFFTSIPKREIECEYCHYATSFVVGINHEEVDGRHRVTYKGKAFLINLPLSL